MYLKKKRFWSVSQPFSSGLSKLTFDSSHIRWGRVIHTRASTSMPCRVQGQYLPQSPETTDGENGDTSVYALCAIARPTKLETINHRIVCCNNNRYCSFFMFGISYYASLYCSRARTLHYRGFVSWHVLTGIKTWVSSNIHNFTMGLGPFSVPSPWMICFNLDYDFIKLCFEAPINNKSTFQEELMLIRFTGACIGHQASIC